MNEKKIVPERIVMARKELALTQTALGERAGLSRVTISKLEKGLITSPSLDTITSLSFALKKKPDFFYLDTSSNVYSTTFPVFRSLKSSSKKYNESSIVKLGYCCNLVEILFSKIKARCLDFGNLFVENCNDINDDDIEDIALDLRLKWNLGDGPIYNLSTLLENHGVICCPLDLPEKIDSVNKCICIPDEGETCVLLYSSKLNYFRQRFSLAHELGHVILHHYVEEDVIDEEIHDLMEKQANRFASAFLMPAASFNNSIYSLSLNGIRRLKEKWRVSMSAIIHRLQDLKIILDSKAQYLYVEISRNGWNKTEPLDKEVAVEKPYFLEKAYTFVFEKGILSSNDVVDLMGLSDREIIAYIGNEKYFTSCPNIDFKRL